MTEESRELFSAYLAEAASAAFQGWDFSHITKTHRMAEAPLGWNYHNVVLPHLRQAGAMLDMGTGGGEALSRFAPLPPKTYATEQHGPNVDVAEDTLGPLGVKVVQIDERYPYNHHQPA